MAVCALRGTLMVVWKTFGGLIAACEALGILMASLGRASAAPDSSSAAMPRITGTRGRFIFSAYSLNGGAETARLPRVARP